MSAASFHNAKRILVASVTAAFPICLTVSPAARAQDLTNETYHQTDSPAEKDSAAARGRFERLPEGVQPPRITLESRIQADGDLSAEDQAAISVAAGRILQHVDEARTALENSAVDTAREEVGKAMMLTQIIERNAPKYQVETTISSGDLRYSDSDTVPFAMIPVYSEVSQLSLLTPIVRAKGEGAIAPSQGEQTQGKVELQEGRIDSGQVDSEWRAAAAAETTATVKDVAPSSTSLLLDIAATRDYLARAQHSLQQNKGAEAQQYLTAVQQSVFLSYSAEDVPIVRARENLGLARIYSESNQTNAAKKALAAASEAIDEYAAGAGTDLQKDLYSLRTEIQNVRNTLESDKVNAGKRIQTLWQRLSQWDI